MNNLFLRIKENYLLFILLWMATLLIFSYSWVPGGLDVDSCNYAVVAKEVLRSGNWLKMYDPVYGGVFYYHFPLCIWVTAFLFKLFGVSAFTAKLFSMTSAVALVGVLYYFGKMLKNQWVGFFAGFSFLITNHIIRLSRQCRMDIPVSLFIALAIFSFILAQRRNRIYYLLFGLFTFLAIFTKDVNGLFALAIVGAYLLARLRFKELIQPLFILGLLTAAAPLLLWIWLDQNTLFYTWFHQNFMHLYKSPGFNVPWYYYIWAIFTKYGYLLPLAAYGAYLGIKEAHKNKTYEFYLLVIWVIIFPLAFSFGSQKLHYFILPIYPAAALMAGLAFDKIIKDSLKPKIASAFKYLLIISSIIMLAFPIKVQSKRFIKTVRMAPLMDKILEQAAQYRFISYNQDKASLLFYSEELSRIEFTRDIRYLDEVLADPQAGLVFCYLSQEDFSKIGSATRQNCKVLLEYKDRLMTVNRACPEVTVILP